MSYIKEDYLLGNKKIIVGDNLHDLVLENLGRIYIRYGNSYKEFNLIIKSLSGTSSSKASKVVIATEGLESADKYSDGTIVYDALTATLYLVYNDSYLKLIEYVGSAGSGYVKKTGDVMTGQLAINTKDAPLIISSQKEINNLNANYLQGYTAEKFPRKSENAEITGNWTFDKETNFESDVNVKGTVTLTNQDTALKIVRGDLITNGSIGSESFASGYAGSGWRLDATTNTLEIDNLIVRNVLDVYELVVNKISATNGSLWITDSFNVAEVKLLQFINCNEEVESFVSDSFYVPYVINDTQISEDTDWETKLEQSKESNYWTIKLDESKYPTASNLEKSTDDNYVYTRFNYFINVPSVSGFKEFLAENNYTTADLAKESVIDEISNNYPLDKFYFYQDNNDNINSTFDKNLFVVGTGDIQPYNDEYTFTEKAYINLYYKYYGEHGVWTNAYILNPEDGEYPVFKTGDILKCQKYYNGNVRVYTAIVLGIADSGYIILTDGSFIPQEKDALVRIGSIYEGIRRNSLMLTSSENDSPYEDVLTNINRPDYTVGYYIPKFKTFELDGKTYYLQDDTYDGDCVTKEIPVTSLDPTSSVSDATNVLTIWESNIPTDNAFYNSKGEEVTINDLYTSVIETPVVKTNTFAQNTTSDKITLNKKVEFKSEFVTYNDTTIVNSKESIIITPNVSGYDNPIYKLYYKYYKDGIIIYKALDITKETDISNLYEGRYLWCKVQAVCGSTILYYLFEVQQVTTELFTNIKNDSNYTISVKIDLDSSSLLQTCKGTSTLTGHEIIETVNGLYKADFVKNTKVRLGNLDGVYDKLLGNLEGFGLYGSNVYLTGNFLLNNGKSLADISDSITLGVGDTKRIQSKVNSLSNELQNTTEQLQDNINQVSNSIDSTIGDYISTNKDSIFKMGLDYSMLALGSAGITIINPNVKYNSDGEVDQSTVGDGDEYISLQGDKTQINSYYNKSFTDSNGSTVSRKMCICTYTHPSLWTYDEDAYIPKYDGNNVEFFIGYVNLLPSSVEQVSASTMKYVSFSSITDDSCTVSGDQYYTFNCFYNNNTETVYSYTQDVYSGTVYFVPRIVNVALFKDGKIDANLINVDDITVKNLIAAEKYDDQGNIDKTGAYVIIDGETGSIESNNGTIQASKTDEDGTEYFVRLEGADYQELQAGHKTLNGELNITTRISGKEISEILKQALDKHSKSKLISSEYLINIYFKLVDVEDAYFFPSGDDKIALYKKLEKGWLEYGYANTDVYLVPNWNFVKPTKYDSSKTYYDDAGTYVDNIKVCEYREITVDNETIFNTYNEQGHLYEVNDEKYSSVKIIIPKINLYRDGGKMYLLETCTLDTSKYEHYYCNDSGTVTFSNICYLNDNVSTVYESLVPKMSIVQSGKLMVKTSSDSLGSSYVSLYKGKEIISGDEIFLLKSDSTDSLLEMLSYEYDYNTIYADGEEFLLFARFNTYVIYEYSLSKLVNNNKTETILGSNGLLVNFIDSTSNNKFQSIIDLKEKEYSDGDKYYIGECNTDIINKGYGLSIRKKRVWYYIDDCYYNIPIPILYGNINVIDTYGSITYSFPSNLNGLENNLMITNNYDSSVRFSGKYNTDLINGVNTTEWWFQTKHHGFKNLDDWMVVDFDFTNVNQISNLRSTYMNIQVTPYYDNKTSVFKTGDLTDDTNTYDIYNVISGSYKTAVNGTIVSIFVHKNTDIYFTINLVKP